MDGWTPGAPSVLSLPFSFIHPLLTQLAASECNLYVATSENPFNLGDLIWEMVQQTAV